MTLHPTNMFGIFQICDNSVSIITFTFNYHHHMLLTDYPCLASYRVVKDQENYRANKTKKSLS